MLDIPVAEVVLDRPRVVSLIGELEAARVPQHVRVHGKFKSRLLPGLGHDLSHSRITHRPSTLRDEHVGRD